MKKMNFYFNFGRCCTWLLPMFLLLSGSMAFAGNGNNPTSDVPSVSKHKTAVMPVAGLQGTLTATAPACPPAANLGTLTATGSVTGYNSSIRFVAQVFQGAVPVGGPFNISGNITPATLGTVTPFAMPAQNLAPGTYMVRIYVVDGVNNVVLETVDLAPATIGAQPAAAALAGTLNNIAVVATAGVCTATSTLTTNGTPAVNVSVNGVSAGTITANGCAGNVTVTGIPANFPLGATVVNWNATGSGGGATAGQFTVTVTAPVLTCTITSQTAAIAPCATTTQLLYTVMTTGGCNPININNTGIVSGSILPAGTYNVAANVTDGQGQFAACTLPIVIAPAVNPALVDAVLTNTTQPIAQCATTTTLTYNLQLPTGGCPPYVIEDYTGPNNGAIVSAGSYTVFIRYRDAAGQLTNYSSLNVVVAPAPASPALVCGAITNNTVAIAACATTTTLNYTIAPPTGGCGAKTLITSGGLASGTVVTAGSYTIVNTWRDAAGTDLTCTYEIVVAPAPAPAPLVCGAFVNNTPAIAMCATTTALNYTIGLPTGGCAPIVLVASSGPASGTAVTAGSYTIVRSYRDANGATLTCTNEITVAPAPVDNVAPTVVACAAPAAVTEGLCGAPVAIAYADATFADNCTPAANLIIDRVGPANGSLLTQGTYRVIFTASDLAGNKTSCSINVVVNKFIDNVAPVLTACPANQNLVVACGALANVVYAAPTATDNCPVTPVTVVQTGPVSGSQLNAGVYPVIFTATDAAGNATTCSFTITVTNPAPTSLSCIGGSATSPGANITLDANCATVIRPNMVLLSCIGNELDYSVVVSTLGGTILPNATVGIGQVGKVVKVEVTYNPTGVKCWGYVKIEDKTAPTIVCPANVNLACANAADANDLAKVGELSGPNSTLAALNQVTAANATAAGALDGTVQECSKWTQYWSDVVTGTVCTGRTITRTWFAKDEWGNQSLPCVQIITIAPPVVPVLGNLLVNTTCTVVTPAVLQDILNNTEAATLGFKVTGFTTTCGFELVPNGVMNLSGTCPGNFTIMRMYKLVNTCTGTFTEHTQRINVTNPATPTVTANFDNYTRVTDGTYCWLMNGTMQMTSDNWKTAINNVTATFNNGNTNIMPLASSTMCNAANIRVQLAGTDNGCFPGALTYTTNDSRIQISASGLITNKNGQPFMKNLDGTNPSFVVTATNACGSSVKHTFTVVLVDNMTPNTVCKVFTTATLDENGFVRVPLSAFENGSSDNCGIERQMVRRMTKSNSNACGVNSQIAETACWNDYVDFTCADIGDTDADGGQLVVVLRSVDAAGNVSDCMVRIQIIDKTGPTCTNAPQIDRLCTDADLSSYKTLFRTPNNFDNCGIKDTTFTDNRELVISCGKGDVTRTWTFTDCSGKTATCTQKIVVTPVYGFTVPKIKNDTLSCSLGTSDITAIMEADRRTIVNSATLNTFAGGKTCSAPVVETEYWKYSSSQYCQIYRVRYTIIDNCAPYFGYTIATPGACNVMTDAQGRLLGTPNATCTLVESIVGANVNGVPQHIVVYERYIYVNDVTAPTNTTDLTVAGKCTTWNGTAQVDNVGCTFRHRKVLTGADNCGGTTAASDPGTLRFMWRAVVKNVVGMVPGTQLGTANGATAAAMNTNIVDLTGLTFGTYTICFRVIDLCGNMSQEYCYDIEGADCKAPEILVHNKIVALGGITGNATTGMAILKYADIRNKITDNCAGDLTNDSKIRLEKGGATAATAPAATATQEVMFTCADLSNGTTPSTYATQRDILVRVWAVDNAGNWNYALSTITLQDNDGICATGTVAIFGAARTENNAIVNNVTVSANVNGASVANATVANGTYTMTMGAASNVQVRATKNNNEDAAQGVTTFDIAKVSQHVLDIEKFTSPYQMIAGDVDKSGEIDATDMLHMRRFILKITPSLPGGNFRFIDKAYTFRNAANPFGEDFPEVVNIASLTANTAANFVAVKLGDVNGSYSALSPRSSRTLSFLANDMNVVAGNEYTVNISTDKMDAAAFQGTFSFNGATVKSVKAGNLANMTDGNFGIFANAVTTSWNGKTQDASDVLAITFVANKSGKLSDMLTVNSALTQAVANDAAGNEMNVNLKFNTGKVAGGEFALYQNQPNPVANETTIGFNLPKDGQARLTITAVDGKVVKVLNGTYKAGYNTVTVNKSDLNASGVFYYRLETADHSASKKMVIIE